MAEEEPKAPAKKGKGLSGKWHGVPKPVLVLGGGLAIYLLYRWYQNKNAAAAANVTPSTATPTTTSTGDTTGGLGGTGSTGSTGSTGDTGSGATAPVGTTAANGAIVNNPTGGTDAKAVAALKGAQAAVAKAKASGNKKAIANATKNLTGAESAVTARKNAATNTQVSHIRSGGPMVDASTYAQQVAASGSGTGKAKPTGVPALTHFHGTPTQIRAANERRATNIKAANAKKVS